MTQVFNRLDEYAAMSDAAIVCVHHTSRGDQSGKSVTDTGAGAGAQSRAADCHIVLRPREEPGHVDFEAVTRSFRPIDPFVLRRSALAWEVVSDCVVTAPHRTQKPTRSRSIRTHNDEIRIPEVLAAIGSNDNTESKIRSRLGSGQKVAQRIIRMAIDRGMIQPVGSGSTTTYQVVRNETVQGVQTVQGGGLYGVVQPPL